jgi:hypothetical protein
MHEHAGALGCGKMHQADRLVVAAAVGCKSCNLVISAIRTRFASGPMFLGTFSGVVNCWISRISFFQIEDQIP